MKVCDYCGKIPEPFDTDIDELAYFVAKWKDDESLSHFMSNGEEKFCVCVEKDPVDDRFEFICINCLEELLEGGEDG